MIPALPDFRLDGKVAIVTGASSGFGDRFARVLAASGATVVAAARRADRLDALATETEGVVAHPCDIADDDAVTGMVDRTIEEFRRIDVVINNAGISDAVTRAEHEDPADFRRVVDVNLSAAFVLAAAAARNMIERGEGGSIVNIASVHALVGAGNNAQAGYSASKGALVQLSRELATQWARHNIRVNAIAPGYFETELTAAMFVDDDSGLRYIKRGTPLGRGGEVSELDGALLLLASDAGSFITGQTIVVDGGWTAK